MSIGSGTGLAAGTSTIAGAYGAQSGTLSITVVDGTLVTASPTSLSLSAGGSTGSFTVTCRKPDGTTDASPTYSTTSSDTSIATVTHSGTTVTVTPVAQGSCTINLSYSNGAGTATASVALTVTAATGAGFNAAQMDPVNTATGQGILGANPSAVPVFFDSPNLYDSDTGGATPWRNQISSALGGSGPGLPNNYWDTNGVRYGDGVNPNDVRWVATPDPAYGPNGWSGPAFEFTFPGTNLPSTIGEHGRIQVKLATWRPSSMWASRIVAFQSTPRWTGVGDSDNTNWAKGWNEGSKVSAAMTITTAITATGVQTVVTSTNHFNQIGTNPPAILINPGQTDAETLTYDASSTPAAGKYHYGADSTHVIINPTKTHAAGVSCDVSFAFTDGGNGGNGTGWKEGPAATFAEGGDSRMETTNWSNTFIGGTLPGANFVGQSLPGGSGHLGITEDYSYGNTDATYNDGTRVQIIVRWENWFRASDSTYWAAETYWRRILGTSTFTRIGRRVVRQSTFAALGHYNLLSPTALNMNWSFKSTQKYWAQQWAFFDLDNPNNDGSNDPFYVNAREATLMPENAGGLAVSNVTTAGMTLTVVNPGRFTGKFRAKIDGAWVTGQDYVMQREDGEITIGTGAPALTSVTFNLTGLTLASGDHPVEVHAVSGDGTQVEPVGMANTATVGTSASGFVNSSSIDAGSGFTGGTYTTPAFSATTGNLILAFVESTTPGSQSITVTDNAANTYAALTSVVSGSTHLHVFYAKNIAGNAALAVSVTDTLADSNAFKLTAMQYMGFNAAAPIDGSTIGSGTAGTTTTGTLTPTGTADTIVGFAKATTGTVVAPSGWASRSARAGFDKKLSAATPTAVTVTSTDGTATVLAALVALK